MKTWIAKQNRKFKLKSGIMSDSLIYQTWDNFIKLYPQHFITYVERWYNSLYKLENLIINFMNKVNDVKVNDVKVNENNSDIVYDRKINRWIYKQFKNRVNNKGLVFKDKDIKKKWDDFRNKYENFLNLNYESRWKKNFIRLQKFIEEKKIFPRSHSSQTANINEKKLWDWIQRQKINFAKKKSAMKDSKNYEAWKKFQEKYNYKFMKNKNKWDHMLQNAYDFVEKNKKNPSGYKNDEKILYNWIKHQKAHYKDRMNIMKNENNRKLWENFILFCKTNFKH